MAIQQSRSYKYPPPVGKRNAVVPLPFNPKQHRDSRPRDGAVPLPNVPIGFKLGATPL